MTPEERAVIKNELRPEIEEEYRARQKWHDHWAKNPTPGALAATKHFGHWSHNKYWQDFLFRSRCWISRRFPKLGIQLLKGSPVLSIARKKGLSLPK